MSLTDLNIWILLGALAGWIASIITNRDTVQGTFVNIVVGIFGALLGGFILAETGGVGETGFSIYGLCVAGVGAVILLFVLFRFGSQNTNNLRNLDKELQSSESPKIRQEIEKQSLSKTPPQKDALGIIFLSYRRADSADVAGRIYDRLSEAFGKVAVFKDVDAIPLGTDFKRFLGEQISECHVMLAVIGDTWLEARDMRGNKRLEDPHDFVRIEIESALERDIPVIPLLVRNASMPSEEELPASLKGLAFRNGTAVRTDPDFHRDMDRVISALKRYVQPKP